MFERVRSRLDAALRAAAAAGDLAPALSRMRDAVLEARSALRQLEQSVEATDAALAAERRQRDDAQRRGRLASGIGDQETAEIAQRFAAKHTERVAVLERKLAAQQDELALARRELAEMVEQLDQVEREQQKRVGTQAASGMAPDEAEEVLRSRMDRAAKEAQAAEQLEALKRRMGR